VAVTENQKGFSGNEAKFDKLGKTRLKW